MKIVVRVVLIGIVIFVISHYSLVSGVSVSSLPTAIVVSLVLGVINIFIRPILIILTLPLNILTLGLFTFVINGLLLSLTANLVPGFEITGFFPAFIAALLITVAGWFIEKIG